jgi:hypothetical protein
MNEYTNFNLVRATMGGRLGKVKRMRRGESFGTIIHICMVTTQGNSL